jgi:hypothetical protein
MSSFLDRLVTVADNNSGYTSCGGFGNSILSSIELGTGNRYHACTEPGKPRRIEVWLHFKRPLVTGECSEFDTIIEHNDIPEYDIKRGNTYDYHLSYFSKAWLEDIMPKLVSTKLHYNLSSRQPIDQMLETAFKCRCDVLDMSTMTIF